MNFDKYKEKPFYLNDEDINWVKQNLNNMTVDEKISQLFCLIAYSADDDYLNFLSQNLKIGGIMCRTMPKDEVIKTVNELQKKSKIPMLIAGNIETGANGVCLGATKFGSQMSIAATNDPSYGYKVGKAIALEAKPLSVNWAFGPICDIDYNFRNPITNTRTFGSNVDLITKLSTGYIKAMQENGIACCSKHFPGDGVDERDQHLVTTVNDMTCEQWDSTYGQIYKKCIDEGVKTIMVGHIMLPNYSKKLDPTLTDEKIMPATLAKELVTTLLKDKLGFNGLVITDSTTMGGINMALPRDILVPNCIACGCDMFLFTKNLEEDFKYMKDGYLNGIITSKRLDDAVGKILALKASLKLHKSDNLANEELINKYVHCMDHQNLEKEIASKSITLVKNKENILPINPTKYKRVLFYSLQSSVGTMGFSVSGDANDRLMKKLQDLGFEVTLFKPKPGFEGTMTSAMEIKNNYDLIIYSANLATKSNQTIVRIEWCEPMGANVPVFTHTVPTIFISLENPYHLIDVPRIKTFINTYCSTDAVLDALIRKLTSKEEFIGVSPVDAFCGKWDTRL